MKHPAGDTSRHASIGLALEQDRALLAAFRDGRGDVLERVYHALVDDVFRLAALGFATRAGMIRPERDHDEQRAIVQDVFVRAFADRARAAYDGVRPYRPYLLTIARNVMIDRVRARAADYARSSEVDVDTIIAADSPLSGDIDEDTEKRWLRERATEYLATVDAETRAFVQLRFDGDLSQADVAAHLRITRRRVRTLEARVIKGLRRFLKKHRPEPGSPTVQGA